MGLSACEIFQTDTNVWKNFSAARTNLHCYRWMTLPQNRRNKTLFKKQLIPFSRGNPGQVHRYMNSGFLLPLQQKKAVSLKEDDWHQQELYPRLPQERKVYREYR